VDDLDDDTPVDIDETPVELDDVATPEDKDDAGDDE